MFGQKLVCDGIVTMVDKLGSLLAAICHVPQQPYMDIDYIASAYKCETGSEQCKQK